MRILARLALLPKLLLSTSITMALLFLFTGWLVQRHAVATASQVVEREVRSSFEAYEALWRSRAAMLASVSRVLSAMSDVRAAFSTGDDATIRDTAGELWARVSDATAIFLVTDPRGRVIASLGGQTEIPLDQELPVVRAAYRLFPEQASGFMHQGAHLYQITITPVYVQSGSSPALLNVLLAGYRVDAAVVNRLKDLTGGSEFLFLAGDRVLASTLTGAQSAALVRGLSGAQEHLRANDGEREYAALTSLLRDVEGNPIAHLWIFRSFESAQQQISALRRNILLIALAAVLAGLAVTYLLARRIVEPIKTLDQAAAEVARQNFDLRVEVRSEDELGRLAATFNAMCDSIRAARVELIRQ